MDLIKEELITPRHSVICRFRRGHKIPLINLDWGSGSLPIKYLEGEVSDQVWEYSSNPNSCGNLVGAKTRDIVNRGKAIILDTLGLDKRNYEVLVGGQGSTYWLERIRSELKITELSVIQRELHTSLVGNCLLTTCSRETNRKVRRQGQLFAFYLSSHVSGTEVGDISALIEEFRGEGVPVLVDATCYLAHNSKLPSWLTYFDYLVFSGHKFPGGVGASGCLIHRRTAITEPPGSPDVYGAFKLFKTFELRTKICGEYDDRLVDKLLSGIESLETEDYKLVTQRWDGGRVSEPIVSFSVHHKRFGEVHPELVCKILLEGYGLQIRYGGVCSDFILKTYEGEVGGILKRGVCRISIHKYLLSESLVDEILERLNSFMCYLTEFIYMFEIKNESWKIRTEFIETDVITNGDGGEGGCLFCRYRPSISNSVESNNPLSFSYGGGLLDKILIEVLPNVPLPDDPYVSHPKRWFVHPRDLLLEFNDIGL